MYYRHRLHYLLSRLEFDEAELSRPIDPMEELMETYGLTTLLLKRLCVLPVKPYILSGFLRCLSLQVRILEVMLKMRSVVKRPPKEETVYVEKP